MITSQLHSAPAEVFSAQPAPDLDALFAPRPTGYVGADVALSIPLGDGRVFWIFGDTLVGECRDNARTWTSMPHNSVAIQPSSAVQPDKIQWHFADDAGNLRAFFHLPESSNGEWFWPGTGCCIDSQLYVFGYGVVAADNDCEALAFRVVRGWMMRVSDTSGDPAKWQCNAAPINWPATSAIFASACCVVEAHVYLTGMKVDPTIERSQRPTLLCRIAIADLLENGVDARPEIWSRHGNTESWSDSGDASAPLFAPAVSESSLYYDTPRRRYIATTYTGSEPHFLVTTAPALTGPWSEPVPIYCSPQGRPGHQFLFYAFRMHPHLATHADEMVMSYMVNARDPAVLRRDTSVYYPRFIRVNLREIP